MLVVPASITSNAPTNLKRARERFLNVHGARLFNLLPKVLRNENDPDFILFKNHLDSLLDQVPLVPDLDLG